MDYKQLIEDIKKLGKEYRGYTAKNLSEMTKIKGLSMQEKEVCECLQKQMIIAGLPKENVWIDKLGNVFGKIGSGKTILAIDGHIDTVDFGVLSNWDLDPLSGKIDDKYVHGRGVADQRGGIAAFTTSIRIILDIMKKSKEAKELIEKTLTIYFVASVMEEDCDGLCWKYIIEESKIVPNYWISTESTNGKIYRGHRGRMEINVEFKGISCHGSAPHRGKNAIYMASRFALEVEKLNEKLKVDDFLGKGTIAMSEFKSQSPSLCAVSDYVWIHLDRRLTWGETKESAVAEVQKIVDDLGYTKEAKVSILDYNAVAYTGEKYAMQKYFPTWKIPEDHEIVQNGVEAFKQMKGKKPEISRWTFSTNGIATCGMHKIPSIGFGPGKEEEAHAPNEKTPIDDLMDCSIFYALYILELAKKKK